MTEAKIVIGFRGSGKTTYINNNLLIDADHIHVPIVLGTFGSGIYNQVKLDSKIPVIEHSSSLNKTSRAFLKASLIADGYTDIDIYFIRVSKELADTRVPVNKNGIFDNNMLSYEEPLVGEGFRSITFIEYNEVGF